MATIYKKGRDKKRNAHWYIDYFDHDGKRKTRKGFTDKSRTEQLAAKLENEALLRKSGMIDPKQEELAKNRAAGLESYLTKFEESIRRSGNTEKHVRHLKSRIRTIVDGCEFMTLGDLSADTVECFLVELRHEKEFGHRTHNHYVQAIEQFSTWLTKKRYVAASPITGLPRLNNETDVRRERRALQPAEIVALIQSARDSEESIQCYDGETRARIYVAAYSTGLRRAELGSLTKNSFDLDAASPTVTVEATNSKHRKKDVLPHQPEFVAEVRRWIVDLNPGDFLFPKLEKRRTWLMVKKDLERVGIPYLTKEGVADFHAAGRHTYITELIRNGVSLPEAQTLARHSDIKMTMRYTHIGIEDQTKAIAKLPNVCQHIVSTSGDSCSPDESQAVIERHANGVGDIDATRAPVSSSGTGKEKGAPSDSDGAPWRRRESNPRPVAPR